MGKDIYIAFENKETREWFVYNHDEVLKSTLDLGHLIGTKSWDVQGSWSWSAIPAWLQTLLNPWRVLNPAQRSRFIPPEHRSVYDEINTWEMT